MEMAHHMTYLYTMAAVKVIIDKSRDELSLLEQEIIENVSWPIFFLNGYSFNFILCNFLVWMLQWFKKSFNISFAPENMKKTPSKVAHNWPRLFSTANRPKSSPNLNSSSVKSHYNMTGRQDEKKLKYTNSLVNATFCSGKKSC